ncbi:MAG: DUF2807 domain-containing protein [Crocinitomicaceae bacterium]
MKIIYFLSFLLIALSCKKENVSQSKTVEVLPFHNIDIRNAFEVVLVEDTNACKIEIQGNKNIDKIKTEVLDGVLVISDLRKMKFLSPKNKIKLKICAPSFHKVTVNGGVNLSNEGLMKSMEIGIVFNKKGNWVDFNLENDVFYFWNESNAGGEIKLKGKTQVLKLWYGGLVNVNVDDLITQTAIIETNTTLNCTLFVEEKIQYKIEGTGNIYLRGNPPIITNINTGNSGGGKLFEE